ncbi:MarR family winged helix-turn-helix transcriptional regulator [Dermatobacter hominis]|uniref:MarR family winged helix-turn-helix transcriptional regulator n=1 Tax=Dermatobacter hominis TaxID=2884263 RepID=UPI001D102BED|nr:MarR family winged helix-turn-helix transcriptional regulator [Dermatobacter hominis]UDY36133.1 MarR family winged helix-turn-helix transcriptional regulator [Dermatobacter hominis]
MQDPTHDAPADDGPADDGPADAAPRVADAARAAVRVARVAANAVAEVDLTLAQYRVMVFVDGVDRPANEVARLLEVSPSTLTSVVDGLCTRDLVRRRSDPTDGRRVVLAITEHGRRRLAAADAAVARRLSGLLGRLGEDRAAAALDGLDILNEAMDLYLAEHFGNRT